MRVRATGFVGVAQCTANASASVVVGEEPPCEVGEHKPLELKDDKIEWELKNLGDEVITISSISVTWPSGIKGNIDKIKLDEKGDLQGWHRQGFACNL